MHAGCVTLGASHRVHHTGCITQGASCRVRHVGCVMQGASSRVRHAGCNTLGASRRVRPLGCNNSRCVRVHQVGCIMHVAPCRVRHAGCNTQGASRSASLNQSIATFRTTLRHTSRVNATSKTLFALALTFGKTSHIMLLRRRLRSTVTCVNRKCVHPAQDTGDCACVCSPGLRHRDLCPQGSIYLHAKRDNFTL